MVTGKNNPLKKVKPPRRRINNSPDHPLHPSAELKLETLRHYFECGDNVKLVAEEIGYTIATIYTWRRLYERNGAAAFMRYQDIPRSKFKEPDSSSSKEIAELKAQIRQLQMEVDILNEAIKIIKKDRGVAPTLSNREKAMMVDALKNKNREFVRQSKLPR